MQVLHYLAVEDLARAWRVAQPNLEQTGLLKIEYLGLDELVGNNLLWTHSLLASASQGARKAILTAVLDHMRSVLVLDDRAFTDDETRRLVQRANAVLCEPWAFDEKERLRRGGVAAFPTSFRATAIATWHSASARGPPLHDICDHAGPGELKRISRLKLPGVDRFNHFRAARAYSPCGRPQRQAIRGPGDDQCSAVASG